MCCTQEIRNADNFCRTLRADAQGSCDPTASVAVCSSVLMKQFVRRLEKILILMADTDPGALCVISVVVPGGKHTCQLLQIAGAQSYQFRKEHMPFVLPVSERAHAVRLREVGDGLVAAEPLRVDTAHSAEQLEPDGFCHFVCDRENRLHTRALAAA
jgi:hypothetical protein